MSTPETRVKPNILITGTPGTGKTTLADELAKHLGYFRFDIGEIVRENKFYTEFDEEYDTFVLDEDAILDFMEERMDKDDGGNVVDYHGSSFFPERWFDFVIVLRCSNTVLHDRLTSRGYNQFKVKQNIECEIFGTLAEEARESYPELDVQELTSEDVDDVHTNIEKISQLIENWRK
ncbi:unnamed protein product [Auanema sp. JU1783]|nr:unnamed protein product [Auanema sp. JU1783]